MYPLAKITGKFFVLQPLCNEEINISYTNNSVYRQ